MQKRISIIILSLIGVFAIQNYADAQDKVPVLKGTMDISITKGTMDCNFTLTGMPLIADYVIIINSGMNIRNIRNIENNYSYYYEKVYNDTISGEGFEYYIPDNTGKGKMEREALRFSYVGKFPVITDTLSPASEDWKGNIAFNGYSVRADGRQAAWYPVLYDVKKQKPYYKLKYDIEITCSDCNTIYLNGNDPVQTKKAHLKSDNPLELMLFAGNYKVHNVDGTFFLNPDISDVQMKEFGVMTGNFKKFYAEKLGIPYKYKITYIQATPVSIKNAWLFVSYPTIVNVGRDQYGMKSFFDKKNGDSYKPFMAHELAHYYFGNYKEFNSGLGNMMGEGFAEYMSFQATKEFLKDTMYTTEINDKIKKLKNFRPIAFSKIENETGYKNHELYVYYYAPVIFTAIEKEVGIETMWSWMRNILETPAEFTDYAFLEQTLRSTLKDDARLRAITEKYFNSDASLENAIATIKEK